MKANISYRRLRALVQQAVPRPRRGRERHSDADVIVAYLWAQLHTQPTYWASRRAAYPPGCRLTPPSAATLSRRLGRVPVIELLSRVRRTMADAVPACPLKLMDSRPLVVGNASNDRNARRGHGAGGRARGYKLCVLTSAGLVREWSLAGMNANDQTLGLTLLPSLPGVSSHGWGYLATDNGFDGNPLHVATAGEGHVLVTPPRRSNRGVRDARRNSPQRIRALDLSDSPLRHAGITNTMGDAVMAARGAVEHTLGHAALLGLGPLPPWVRTPRRVARHVEAMLIFHTYRVLELRQQRLTKTHRLSP